MGCERLSTPRSMCPTQVLNESVRDSGRILLSAQECRPPRQPPCARVPRSSPVAAEAEPCVSSSRLRDAISSWKFEYQIGDVPQLHQVCQTWVG